MQYNNQECVELLKQLIAGHRARIASYVKIMAALNNDVEAEPVFLLEALLQQSQQMKAQLTPLVTREGEGDTPQDENTEAFDIDLQEDNASTHSHKLLTACKNVEDTLLARYEEAEKCNEIIEEQIRDLISSQARLLAETRERIILELQQQAP